MNWGLLVFYGFLAKRLIEHLFVCRMEDKYEPLKELGSGNFGVARLVRDKKTKELLAVKYIERGTKVYVIRYIKSI